MQIKPHLITGFAFGIEYVPESSTEDGWNYVVLDLGILRLMFLWDAE
jgi:hypothetical protein